MASSAGERVLYFSDMPKISYSRTLGKQFLDRAVGLEFGELPKLMDSENAVGQFSSQCLHKKSITMK